ncbi:hypothetical protein SAMN06298216_0727 [Spirosomataceae bacterium TFI 002]|nr:hypothetical protein SAMN06298216_0727 [Spirosomataceae bacterium TFI 002]
MFMKSLILIILTVIYHGTSIAQNSNLINKAELLICQNQFENAAVIYDEMLGSLLSQDHYNAALCHIKIDNFEGAKKHLNKMAQRGVSSDELLKLSSLVNSNDWKSYMITYHQFLEYSEKDNNYTQFELEMNNLISQIEGIEKKLIVRFNGGLLDHGNVEVIFDGEVVKTITVDSTFSMSKYEAARDSIKQTEKFASFRTELKTTKTKMSNEFVHFLNSNPWPLESDLNANSVYSNESSFLQFLDYLIQPSPYTYVTYGSKGVAIVSSALNSIDSLTFVTNNASLRAILNEAVSEGKVKAIDALKIFDVNAFKNYSSVKALSFYVNENGCNDFGDKIYFELIPETKREDLLPPNLESREEVGKKYIYLTKHPDLFIFGIEPQIEAAHFESCESAKNYFKSKNISFNLSH